MTRILPLILAVALALGCYTTTYYNFSSPTSDASRHLGTEPNSNSAYWRNFWLFGWVPGELRIDAAGACGGSEHVAKLMTEQSFAQGLIEFLQATVSSVNVYSPYSARVVCDHGAVGAGAPSR